MHWNCQANEVHVSSQIFCSIHVLVIIDSHTSGIDDIFIIYMKAKLFKGISYMYLIVLIAKVN